MKIDKKKIFSGKTLLFLIVAFYLATRLAYLDRFPAVRVDEVWYTQPAYTFSHEGKFAMPTAGTWMNQDKIVYLIMPIFPITSILFFKIFGFGYVAGRLVSVMYGLLTVIVVYFLGKKVRDEKTGLLAAVIITIDTLFFFETRQIRPEAPVIFFSSLGALLYLIAISDKKGRKAKYFACGMSLALAIFSHPSGILIIATLVVYAAITRRLIQKDALFVFLGGAVPSVFYALFALIDINTFLLQAETNWVRLSSSGVWQTPVIKRILTEPLRYAHYIITYKSVTSFVLAIAALLYVRKTKEEKINLMRYLAVMPLILLFFVAGKSHWYLALVFPYVSVLVAILVLDAAKKKGAFGKVQVLILIVFATHIIYSVGGQAYVIQKNKGFDYDEMCEKIRSYVKENAVIIGTPPFWFCFADKKFYQIELLSSRPAIVQNITQKEILAKYRPEYYITDEYFITYYMYDEFNKNVASLLKSNDILTETTDPVYGKVTLYRGPYYSG